MPSYPPGGHRRAAQSDPPLTEPPADYADAETPSQRKWRLKPLKRGAAALLVVIALFTLSPLIILAVLIWLWWEALKWATS